MKQIFTPGVAEDFKAATLKHTGHDVDWWDSKFKHKLMRDIDSGRLHVNRWIPIERVHGFLSYYGLTEFDDIVYSVVDTEHVKMDNPQWNPPGKKILFKDKVTGKPVEKVKEAQMVLAVRLNPEKYGYLS